MLRQLQRHRNFATLLMFLGLALLGALQFWGGPSASAQPPAAMVSALPRLAVDVAAWRGELDWSRVVEGKDGFVQPLKDGGHVELTLDPRMQRAAARALEPSP